MKSFFGVLLALTAAQLTAQVFAPGAKLERIYEGGHLTEGVAVAPDGTVFFSDITFTTETGMQAGHILRYDPKSGKTAVYRSPSGMSNGLKFDAQGRMLAAEGADYGGRRITRTDLATGIVDIRPFRSSAWPIPRIREEITCWLRCPMRNGNAGSRSLKGWSWPSARCCTNPARC